MMQFRKLKICLLFILVSAMQAQPVKRIYLGNDDHTDFMWTANETDYNAAFVKMLDYYLDQIDATKSNPEDFQARFNCDGSYWMQAYQKQRTPKQFERLIAAIKSGHISMPLHPLINCYGGMPTEAAFRGMFYAGQIERKYDLRFSMAGSMENNTIPLGMSSIWAGSGAKYSWYGIGGYGSQLSYDYRADRRNQLYKYTGLDGSGVLMKWYMYDEKKTAPLGGYAETRTAIPAKNPVQEISTMIPRLEVMCDTISANSKYPFNAAAAFGYGHDDLETYLSPEFIQVAKNGTTPSRKVRVAILEDFFKDIEKNYPNLPSETVTYGNEWDLLSASMNETTAKMRRSTEKLRSAEALASIVGINQPNFDNDLEDLKNTAWNSFASYWEHDWTGDSKVAMEQRPAWQIKMQENLTVYTDSLFNRSRKSLGNQLQKSKNPRFYVFNPLGWSRSDVADFEWEGDYPFKVIDLEQNQEVSSQIIMKSGKKYIRLLASNIPSVGYKVFEIKKGTAKKVVNELTVANKTISNKYYQLTLSPSGVITNSIDKLSNREMVKPANGKYFNDLGVEDINHGSPIVLENSGPISVTLKAVSDLPIKHTTRVTLFANSPDIVIENSIDGNFDDVKTWSFSFNLNNPTTQFEELGAVLKARLETNGGHYASQNARYDWQTFNHFADLSEENYGITISNLDCSFFKLGESSIYSLDENASQIHALAGGRIDKKVEDGNYLGFPKQNGEVNFNYNFAITSHQSSFDATAAMKFAMEHQNSFVTGIVEGAKGTLKKTSFSLLSVSNPDIILWSVKPSEEGIENGLITRFWNMKNTAQTATITLKSPITEAWKTTHIETNEMKLSPSVDELKVDFKQNQINTFRVLVE
jgi:alpha-mannosidase